MNAAPLRFHNTDAPRPLAPFVDSWIDDRKRQGNEDTERDRVTMNAMLGELGWRFVEDMDRQKFRAYLAEKSRTGWCARTQHKRHSLMSRLLAFLIDEQAIEGPNWALAIPRAKVRNPSTGKDSFTFDQVAAIMEAARRRNGENRAQAYLTLFRTGMRPSDYRRAQVGGVVADEGGKALQITRAKSGRARMVPLHPEVLPWVDACMKGKAPDAALFPALPRDKELGMDMAAAGLDPSRFGYSSFRKGFTADRALAGAPLTAVQHALGHSDPKLTAAVYTRFSGAQLREGLRFTEAVKKSSTESLDTGTKISEDHGATTNMPSHSPTIHDDSSRGDRQTVVVANGSGRETPRLDPPCVSGQPGNLKATSGIRTPDLCFTKASSRGTVALSDSDSPTAQILILVESAVRGVVDAERADRPDAGRWVSIAKAAMDALGLRMARHNRVHAPTA